MIRTADRSSICPPAPYGYPLTIDAFGLNTVSLDDTFSDPGMWRSDIQRADVITCPFSHVLSLAGHGATLMTYYDDIHNLAGLTIPAGSLMLVTGATDLIWQKTNPENNTDTHLECEIVSGPVLSLACTSSGDCMVSWSISGPGGYSASRTFKPGVGHKLDIRVPYPCDVKRTLTVDIVGAGASIAHGLTGTTPTGVLIPSGVPDGWDPVTWAGREGSSAMLHRHVSLSSGGYDERGMNGSCIGRSSTYEIASKQMSGWTNVQTIPGFSGVPVFHAGAWYRAEIFAPYAAGLSGAFAPYPGSFGAGVVRHTTAIYWRVRKVDQATITIKRNADWSMGGTPSITVCTHTHDAGAPPPPEESPYDWVVINDSDLLPHPSGAKLGFVAVEITADYAITDTGIIYVEAPCPLPYAVSAPDGSVIPGATHADARSLARGATILAVAGTHTSSASFPADPAWNIVFTGRPAGYYYVRRIVTSEYGSSTYYHVPTSRDIAVSGIAMPYDYYSSGNAGPMLSPGGNVYMYSTWLKPANPGESVELDLIALPITHNTLAIGDNNTHTSFSTMGLPSVTSGATPYNRLFGFHKFVAAESGVYTFDFFAHAQMGKNGRFAVWSSTDDPYCAHDLPDAVEDVLMLDGISCSLTGTLPTSTTDSGGTPSMVAINLGVGSAEQYNGKLLQYRNRGVAGLPLDFRVYDCPDGTPILVQPTTGYPVPYKRAGDTWIKRGDNLPRLTRELAAGQTLYIRLGLQSAVTSHRRNGMGFDVRFPSYDNTPIVVRVTGSA